MSARAMKTWLSLGGSGLFVLAIGMTAPACSGPDRTFISHGGAAGASAMSGGTSGNAGGTSPGGRVGGGGQPSNAGMAGDETEDMAGAGGGCSAGYTETPSAGCVDINECKTNNGDCDTLVTCTNTPGSRVCGNCPFGYNGDGEAGCVDINECATNNGGCDKTVTCNNKPGGYTCGDCSAGYTGGGASGCVDIDECATNNGGCSANATCTNTAGSRTCACKSGYSGDGSTCNAPGAGCKWSCTTPGCAQVALDSDADGHGSSACAAAPGDDCDDTQSAIYPGASELCDGLDNDCDRKIDLSDGLALVGAVQDLPSLNHAAVAAVSNDGSFGLVGTSSSASGLFYGSISKTGVGSVSSGTIFSPAATTAYLNPHIAWGVAVGNYGVAYATAGKGGQNGSAGMMAFTSCCWVDVTSPGEGDVTARGQGDLLFVGAAAGNLGFSTQNGGTPLTANVAISGSFSSYHPQVASNGTSSGAIWQLGSPHELNWSLLSATLTPGATERLSTSAEYADLETITAGYGLAWIEGVGFRFMIKKTSGATQCTSNVVPFGTVPLSQQVAVSDSANGNIVVATSPDSNLIHLYRFDNACKLVDDIDVSTTSIAPTEPRVVRGSGHVVVYWTDNSGGHYRFLSDLLCH